MDKSNGLENKTGRLTRMKSSLQRRKAEKSGWDDNSNILKSNTKAKRRGTGGSQPGSRQAPQSPSRSQRGSSAVEFALALPLMALSIVGSMELAMLITTNALMEGAIRDAARYGITGLGDSDELRLQTVNQIISERSLGMIQPTPERLDVLVYNRFADIGVEEPYTDDSPANGEFDDGEEYTDVNGNGSWDTDQGSPGPGSDGDIVFYRLTYRLPMMTGILSPLLDGADSWNLTASIAVLNEPFRVE